jgi:hypothetical protein
MIVNKPVRRVIPLRLPACRTTRTRSRWICAVWSICSPVPRHHRAVLEAGRPRRGAAAVPGAVRHRAPGLLHRRRPDPRRDPVRAPARTSTQDHRVAGPLRRHLRVRVLEEDRPEGQTVRVSEQLAVWDRSYDSDTERQHALLDYATATLGFEPLDVIDLIVQVSALWLWSSRSAQRTGGGPAFR